MKTGTSYNIENSGLLFSSLNFCYCYRIIFYTGLYVHIQEIVDEESACLPGQSNHQRA